MRVLMAEDDSVSRTLLQSVLTAWGYEPIVAKDGDEAWRMLQEPDAPDLVILDWMMPGLDGVEVCRRARALDGGSRRYVIMLTALESKGDLAAALDAGADDYVVKPFDHAELKARLSVGARVLQLQAEVGSRMRDLERALHDIKTLHGLLPICSYCKKVRDDQNYWQQVEAYVESRAAVQFSHGICPDCYEREVRPHLK